MKITMTDGTVLEGTADEVVKVIEAFNKDEATGEGGPTSGWKVGDLAVVNQRGHGSHGKVVKIDKIKPGFLYPYCTIDPITGNRLDMHRDGQLEKPVDVKDGAYKPGDLVEVLYVGKIVRVTGQTIGFGKGGYVPVTSDGVDSAIILGDNLRLVAASK